MKTESKEKKKLSYEGLNKSYTIEDNPKVDWVQVIFLILAIALIILSGYFITLSTNFGKDEKLIEYSESGNVDYKVYLKENEFYEESFLESNKQYIANIINTINVDYKYEIHSTENMNFDYKYKIIGTLIITDRTNPDKVLYEKEYVLKEQQVKKVTDNNFVISEDVDIDYDVYNGYVNRFKQEYALSVDSKLVVSMDVEATGSSNLVEENINKSQKLEVSIPLSEQTVDIKMATNSINNSESLTGNTGFEVVDKTSFIIGITTGVFSIIIVIIIIIILVKSSNKKSLYEKEKRRILKQYDQLIVTSNRPQIDERNFANIVSVSQFSELYDACMRLKQPIIFYEVVPNEKSYFLVIAEDTLYKFKMSKGFVSRHGTIDEIIEKLKVDD